MRILRSDHGEDAIDTAGSPAALAYLAALAMTAFAVVIAFALESAATMPNLSLVFVIPVLLSAIFFGLGPSLIAAVTGALAYNFFFVEPRLSFRVDDAANIWAIGLLLVVGVIASGVASTAGRQRSALRKKEQQLRALQRFAKALQSPAGDRSHQQLATDALAEIFEAPVTVLALKDGAIQEICKNSALATSEQDLNSARLCLEHGLPTRAGIYPHQSSQFSFWPVTPSLAIGLAFDADDYPEQPSQYVEIIVRLLCLQMRQGV
ncbi:hypothetical protein ASE63_23605 [Bosea sp. Root381]|uniref:DUF4118 domain-containing protein n=1 Tax=Bosea sp. Root381 TaxID=1736524 RepID=UPI0007137574|nr:DUF4118 domain-containing protein [Bosea sp. Root381]KRE06699.1 hypothetical protein ASE63_23605 [Bosea sp. Root381]